MNIFLDLVNIRKENNETYRALMSRVNINLKRCVMDRDPIVCLQHEFFLKPLPSSQAHKHIEAAGDYISTPTNQKYNESEKKPTFNYNNNHNNNKSQEKPKAISKDTIQCFKCKKWGHNANKCKRKINLASRFTNINDGFVHIPGKVNQQEISVVKDTGASMTLLRENLVDTSCILTGQKTTLYTAIGQPFEAQLVVVNLDTPYVKGHCQVGLVPD
ncbi:unnamed protein product [Mytilus coruscus]|uniref:CCHC-type domain-containing protein n=1 Tax=Mytilus coruscus TaxID=42192 RepID=A0A6J8BXJ3_MYTCO|nr:unnamed protein product [Mytilus coruscus]